MKIRLENSIRISPLTGAKLCSFALVAESAGKVYYAVYTEGSAIKTVAMPSNDGNYERRILEQLYQHFLSLQNMADTVFLSVDINLAREGKISPEFNANYWNLRQAVENLPEIK